ncbi:unnamed protein product, partial [marine sediment metagenome]
YAIPGVWYGSLHIDPGTDYPFFAGYEYVCLSYVSRARETK